MLYLIWAIITVASIFFWETVLYGISRRRELKLVLPETEAAYISSGIKSAILFHLLFVFFYVCFMSLIVENSAIWWKAFFALISLTGTTYPLETCKRKSTVIFANYISKKSINRYEIFVVLVTVTIWFISLTHGWNLSNK